MFDVERQRPWSTTEIARMISTPGHVPGSIERLRTAGLIHCFGEHLACASHPSVRFFELSQGANLSPNEETESAVLEGILARTGEEGSWTPELKIHRAFGAKKGQRKLSITDALTSLHAAGLIDRRSERVLASEVARRLDQLTV
ncbi:MAG: hypothetical protein WAN93_00795 [Solirubrobacteraceae bacterium]